MTTGSAKAGIAHQEVILEALSVIKTEIEKAKLTLGEMGDEKEQVQKITNSFQLLTSLAALIENESAYFFELSNCKDLMMTDNLAYIKKLEQELQELKS
jgi:hypothetical protein